MKECPKCGRQNQPTRKYCTRCGASLLKTLEESPVAPQEPAVAEKPAAPVSRTVTPSPAAEEPLVRPSKVATDRMRPPERHVEKTELEKAREAFARAEDVGIDEETGEGIVETRMLRASEVRELMNSAASWTEPAPAQPPGMPEGTETPAAPTMPTPKDIERGILGSKSEFVDKPQPAQAAPPPQPSTEQVKLPPGIPESPPQPTSPQPKPAPISKPTPAPPKTAAPLKIKGPPKAAAPPKTPVSPVKTPTPQPTFAAKATPTISAQDVVAEMREYEAKILDKTYFEDQTIKGHLTDLRHLLIEMKQVQSELDSCCERQDETVAQYRNVSEVKRISFESLQEQTKHAKDEWKDAEKEYDRAEERRKKEISSIEKRIDKVEKQIQKADSSMIKRAKELDKEKEKRAKEEAKG